MYTKCPKCSNENAIQEIITKVIVCKKCGYRGL